MARGFFLPFVDQNVDQSILVRRLGLTAQDVGYGIGQFILHVGHDMRISVQGDGDAELSYDGSRPE